MSTNVFETVSEKKMHEQYTELYYRTIS